MPSEGASIGTVYVDVEPKAAEFWTRFHAQVTPQAGKAGEELGAVIGKGIQDRIAKGVTDGLKESSRSAVPESVKAGEVAGEAFGKGYKARLAAALRSLPKAKLDAESTDADRAIASVRAQIASLRNAKIGVDIDAATARTRLDEIKAALAAVDGKHVTAEVGAAITGARNALAQISVFADEVTRTRTLGVDADTGAAGERLGQVEAEADTATRDRTINVDVDEGAATSKLAAVGGAASISAGGFQILISAGIALAPAIVPAAAAAAAAVAAIGPMALVGAAGIGVLLLAFAPVIKAFQALDAAQSQSGQSAASAASKQLQLASAADAVRSAQASLANTVANAAESQRRANEQVGTAEREVIDAQRQALVAQQALTAARLEAARAAEDLSSRVAHNALDQRQAALDQTKAEQTLAAARRKAALDPSAANKTALAEAQLAYDQQIQRVKDLSVEEKRLAADKAESDRRGIEGSTQVAAAQDRVRSTTVQVAKAERALDDARRAAADQQRQNAFAIQQAQQGVINAQRSLQAATVSAGETGSAAMNKLAAAMDALSPAGQRFVTFLQQIRPQFSALQRAAEEGLFPGIEAGLKALLPYMPQITIFVGRIATAFGKFFEAIGKGLASPFWANFFDQLSQFAGPALQNFATFILKLAEGFGRLLLAFLPLSDQMGQGLADLATRFANFIEKWVNSDGFSKFIAYVQEQGPKVLDLFKNLLEIAFKLLIALKPLGDLTLQGLDALAKFLSRLSPGQLIGIGAGFGAIAIGIVAIAGGPIALVTAAIVAIAAALVYAWTHSETFRNVVTGAFDAVKTAVTTAWDNIRPILVNFRDFFITEIGPKINDWVENVVKPGFHAAGVAVHDAWVTLIQPALTDFKNELVNDLGPAILSFKDNVVVPAFQGIGAVIDDRWRNFIKPALEGWRNLLKNDLEPAMNWIADHVVTPVWERIKFAFDVGSKFLSIALGLFQIGVKVAGVAWEEFYLTKIKPGWDLIRPVFDAFGKAIEVGVVNPFKVAVVAISRAWDAIVGSTRQQLALLATIINKFLIEPYNRLATKFHVNTVSPIEVEVSSGLGQRFAAGGHVRGAGGPTDDRIPAWLSNGEYVVPARVVAALGVDFFDQLVGRAGPRARYPGDGSQGLKFADGGLVNVAEEATLWGWVADPAARLLAPLLRALDTLPGGGDWRTIAVNAGKTLANGLMAWVRTLGGSFGESIPALQSWIRAQAGKPYIWDSAGPEGFDCSGILSAVWNLAHRRNPNSHTFSTYDEARYFPFPGLGVFTAGWSNPGEGGPGGGFNDVGHTAGLLAGLPFESRGGDGVVVGPGVTAVGSFAHVGHYDMGGLLPPGLTFAFNGTGAPETIRTAEQEARLQAGLQTGLGRATVAIEHFHTGLADPTDIAAELDWIARSRGGR